MLKPGLEPIRLNYLVTPAYKEMTETIFLASLKDNFWTLAHDYPEQPKYFSKGFGEAMLFKLDRVVESLEENPGTVQVWSDTDIVFFRPTEPMIRQALAGHDLAVSPEHEAGPNTNTGFYAARPTPEVIRLFKDIRDRCRRLGKVSEQPEFDHLARGRNLHTLLTRTCRTTSMTNRFPPDAVYFHANDTGEPAIRNGFTPDKYLSPLGKKMQMLRDVRRTHG